MKTILHRTLLLGLLATASTAWAAPAAWHLGEARDAKHLSIAGVRAGQIVLDPDLRADQAETLALDVFDRSVTARRTRFEPFVGGWTWTGQVGGEPGHFVVLTSADGNIAGLVSTHEGTYEIRPDHAGVGSLIELDATAFPPCGGAIEPPSTLQEPEEAPSAIEAPQGGPVTIDVMLLYTDTVLAALGGEAQVRAQAQAAVAASNTSFANSDMTSRFNLVAVLPSPIQEGATGTDMGTYLSAMPGNAQIGALRDENGADMVSLLINDDSTACGIGYVMRSVGPGFAPVAYQVTASGCAVGNLSYAHEHGHNMGMEHDAPNGTSPSNASYPWSFGYTIDGNYRTVMAYATACPNGCTRQAYFSNPAVVYNGVATGVADVADNHRTGNLTGSVVAAFRAGADRVFTNGFDSLP